MELNEAFGKLAARLEMDLLLFAEGIYQRQQNRLQEIIAARPKKRERVGFVFSTWGGSPDSAYRIGRCLQEHYPEVVVLVFGPCKSAGTLVVTGSDMIVMSNWGELGPVDIQLIKQDEIGMRVSGTDVEHAFERIRTESIITFERTLKEIQRMSSYWFSSRTAADIAAQMTVGLISPITRQIDPLKLGETARQMRIVQEYGARLARGRLLPEKAVEAIVRLCSHYPDHGFVIDRNEACSLFGDEHVRAPTGDEQWIEFLLKHHDFPVRVPPDGFQHDSFPYHKTIQYLDEIPGVVRPEAAATLSDLPLFAILDENSNGQSAPDSTAQGTDGGTPPRARTQGGA